MATPQSAQPPNPVAARMQRHRERRRAGTVRVAIDLDPELVDGLIGLGWLLADRRQDREAVGKALLGLAEQARDLGERVPILVAGPGWRLLP